VDTLSNVMDIVFTWAYWACRYTLLALPVSRRPAILGGETLSARRTKGKVGVGDVAPDFTLPSQSGEEVSIRDFIGRKRAIVLFFYPKDDTPGCTKEACSFRDGYEQFEELEAEVIGISSDSVRSHERFVEKYGLPFVLLSDEGGEVRKLYGVPNTLGLFPGRVTYVIDEEGVVRHVFFSQLQAARHVEQALEALEAIG
jgi:peroxiredoxin Q/BCP